MQILCGDQVNFAIHAIIRKSGPAFGFTKADVSAQSLYVRGAISILLTWVDTDINRLFGRRRSNTMLCYFHTTTKYFI